MLFNILEISWFISLQILYPECAPRDWFFPNLGWLGWIPISSHYTHWPLAIAITRFLWNPNHYNIEMTHKNYSGNNLYYGIPIIIIYIPLLFMAMVLVYPQKVPLSNYLENTMKYSSRIIPKFLLRPYSCIHKIINNNYFFLQWDKIWNYNYLSHYKWIYCICIDDWFILPKF